jgi:hypothetical protein
VGLLDERTASSEITLKLYHPRGLGAGRQHFSTEAPDSEGLILPGVTVTIQSASGIEQVAVTD